MKEPWPLLAVWISLMQSAINFFSVLNILGADEKKDHYSLLAIAEAVGFNSKSAFNVAFKKQTTVTPSDFRKACKGIEQHL